MICTLQKAFLLLLAQHSDYAVHHAAARVQDTSLFPLTSQIPSVLAAMDRFVGTWASTPLSSSGSTLQAASTWTAARHHHHQH